MLSNQVFKKYNNLSKCTWSL